MNPIYKGRLLLLFFILLIFLIIWSSNNTNDPQHDTFSLVSVNSLEIYGIQDTLDITITDTSLMRPIVNQLLSMRKTKVKSGFARESKRKVGFRINYKNGKSTSFRIFHHPIYKVLIRGHEVYKNDTLETEILKVIQKYGIPNAKAVYK